MSYSRRSHNPVNPAVRELKIGPFSGGINRYSDPSAIADTELVDCVNFDIDLDGSLKSRPPWNTFFSNNFFTYFTGTLNQSSTKILGSFVLGGNRLVVYEFVFNYTTSGGATQQRVELDYCWMDGPLVGTTFVIAADTTTSTNNFSNVVRYKDTLYVTRINGGSSYSFTIDPTTGAVTSTVRAYPSGSKMLLYKERMWIVGDKSTNTSRMYFSDVADPNTYQPASFFDIRPGDGDTLNDAIVYQDNVYLFKNSSIWVFAYDTQPTQAVLTQLHDDLGVDNAVSLALYENVIYFLKWNQVYQIANYDFTRISTKLPFEEDKTLPVATNSENWAAPNGSDNWKYPSWLSLVGDRLVVRYFNRLYVYHLRMRAWSRWNSQDPVVNYMGYVVRVEDAGIPSTTKKTYATFVAGDSLLITPFYGQQSSSNYNIVKMNDTYDTTSTEVTNWTPSGLTVTAKDILPSIKTKIYDIGISHRFKRLMHWGVDVVTGRDVTGILSPFSLAYRVTWDQVLPYMWNQLNTWGYPLFVQPNTTQTATVDSGVYRRYIRFPKSLRYRLLQMEVDMKTVGNTSDGPARLYSTTVFTALKQLVSKGVN